MMMMMMMKKMGERLLVAAINSRQNYISIQSLPLATLMLTFTHPFR
jgi:hypothetical protein